MNLTVRHLYQVGAEARYSVLVNSGQDGASSNGVEPPETDE